MIGPFADQDDLLRFARDFLKDRTESLERDVRVCIADGATAAFPAILYAFATIDLLGALFGGDAESKRGMALRAKRYMRRFMGYSERQCAYLMEMFRHKIVHLALPAPVVREEGSNLTTSWSYSHDGDRQDHLKLMKLGIPHTRILRYTKTLSFTVDQRFQVNINTLVEDIVKSVHAPGNYLESLASDAQLQRRFAKAVAQIFQVHEVSV